MIFDNNVIQVFKKYNNVILLAIPLRKPTTVGLGVVLVIEYKSRISTEPQRSGSSYPITSVLLSGLAAMKSNSMH
jgi:hypothetical protein